MKKTIFIILCILVAFQTVGISQKNKKEVKIKVETASPDSLEYSLIIIDPGFDAWLATQPPENFYSNNYYAIKDRLYVTEWNLRHETLNYNGLYDDYIDYRPDINYGIDLNYKLFYYFEYFEITNQIKLLNGFR